MSARLSGRQAYQDNVVVTDAAERIWSGIRVVLRWGLILLIQQLLRSGKLDRESAYPSYSVVSDLKAAALHVQRHV